MNPAEIMAVITPTLMIILNAGVQFRMLRELKCMPMSENQLRGELS